MLTNVSNILTHQIILSRIFPLCHLIKNSTLGKALLMKLPGCIICVLHYHPAFHKISLQHLFSVGFISNLPTDLKINEYHIIKMVCGKIKLPKHIYGTINDFFYKRPFKGTKNADFLDFL